MTIDVATNSGRNDEILRRVDELAPRFRGRVPAAEDQRSIPRESVEDLVNAGLARLLVPAEHGGLDLTIRDAVDTAAAVARCDASTGWIAWLMMHVPHVVAMFPAQAQAAVWAAGPDAVIVGSHMGMTVAPAPGGYRISGRGAFTSGVNNADWVYVGGMEPAESGPPQLRYFLLRKGQYTVQDTWDTVGMRGTGSNTVVVDDVFVPDGFTLAHVDAREGTGPGAALNASPALRRPWVTKGSLGFIATVVGAAHGAFDEVVASVATKRGPGGVRAAESEIVQQEVGIVGAKLDAAYALLRRLADRGEAAGALSLSERTSLVASGTFVVTLALEVIDKLLELSGTSGFASTAVVQQSWRDIHFAVAHVSLSRREPNARYGRDLLGVPDKAPGMFF